MSYASFLSCALSFEGEFNRHIKEVPTDPIFDKLKVKVKIKKAIKEIRENVNANDGSDSEKEVNDYFDPFFSAIKHADITLAHKFDYAKSQYSDIINDYFEKLIKRECPGTENQNWGGALSKMRNNIGHGDPLPIERKHVAVFQMARYLIYVIILDSVEMPHNQIKRVLGRLFK